MELSLNLRSASGPASHKWMPVTIMGLNNILMMMHIHCVHWTNSNTACLWWIAFSIFYWKYVSKQARLSTFSIQLNLLMNIRAKAIIITEKPKVWAFKRFSFHVSVCFRDWRIKVLVNADNAVSSFLSFFFQKPLQFFGGCFQNMLRFWRAFLKGRLRSQRVKSDFELGFNQSRVLS